MKRRIFILVGVVVIGIAAGFVWWTNHRENFPRDLVLHGNVRPQFQQIEQLIDDYSHFAPPAEGEVLQGHVLKVTPSEVIVDFGYKSEGLVPIAQFLQPDGSVSVRPGDPIDEFRCRNLPRNPDGPGTP